MRVNISARNPALEGIFIDANQLVFLDANLFIPPDKSKILGKGRAFDFKQFMSIWLEPIFESFPNLTIHEAVYNELVIESIRQYADEKIGELPPRLIIHRDSSLRPIELILRNTIEEKIYPHTKYYPLLDNKDDRGEVKSLSYMAVKGYIYFAANDSNAISLIEKAEELSTGLDNLQAIKMYELIYYLLCTNKGDKESLRMLYKYQYYLTNREKATNPNWEGFTTGMDMLYKGFNNK